MPGGVERSASNLLIQDLLGPTSSHHVNESLHIVDAFLTAYCVFFSQELVQKLDVACEGTVPLLKHPDCSDPSLISLWQRGTS